MRRLLRSDEHNAASFVGGSVQAGTDRNIDRLDRGTEH